MIIKLIIFVITLTNIQANMMYNGKEEINFYAKGKLMWLIDDTSMNRKYDMLTYDDYKRLGYQDTEVSFEYYLNYVNTNPKYKYTDWRLPTIEELKTLEYKGYWIFKYFTSSEHRKNDISIDKDIFYDIRDNDDALYWASDIGPIRKDGKKTFGFVSFKNKRFKQKSTTRMGNSAMGDIGLGALFSSNGSIGGEGIDSGYGKYTNAHNLRLVRDIKEN